MRLPFHAHRTGLALMALIALAACARPRIPVGPVPERGPEPDTGVERSHAGEEDADYVRSRHLLLPVAGVRPDQLSDSFDEPRDGNRRHHAIDILAPRGTPVLAADDGVILRRSWNSAGGNTIYAADSELRIVYYYAHLDHYRDSLAAGMRVARGDTIGFVGTTGNAPKDIPHLHFQIMRMPRDGKYWNGDPMNPFALLRVDVDRDHIVGKRD